MRSLPFAVETFLRRLLIREEGQDLVEYALVMSMMTFGTITGMGSLASSINNVFSAVTSTLASNL